jgi:hypothetical protein
MDIFIQLNNYSQEVSDYADRLGGICQGEAISDNLVEQQFHFNSVSMAEQFDRSVRVFPEVMHVGNSADLIAQAIANSRLCGCGKFTIHDCNSHCEGLATAKRRS